MQHPLVKKLSTCLAQQLVWPAAEVVVPSENGVGALANGTTRTEQRVDAVSCMAATTRSNAENAWRRRLCARWARNQEAEVQLTRMGRQCEDMEREVESA